VKSAADYRCHKPDIDGACKKPKPPISLDNPFHFQKTALPASDMGIRDKKIK
jgi:hypothetical protein